MQKFVADLNKLYCLKSHLTERIVDLGGHHTFAKAKYAIQNLVDQTDAELENLDLVFNLVNKTNSFVDCQDLVRTIENIFDDLSEAIEYPQLAHTLFYEYLSQIKSLEKDCLITLCRFSMEIENSELKKLLINELNSPECKLLTSFKDYYPASFGHHPERILS
jgi:ferritin-like metal-binding protein YciE